MSRHLLVSTDRHAQAGPSGYARLSAFVPDSEFINCTRTDPRRLGERVLTRLLGLRAASRWYRLGSLAAERQAARYARRERPALVHMLWGDQDWGYLHRWLPRETAFVATIHNPRASLGDNFAPSAPLDQVDQFILMSPDQAEFLVERGVPRERCRFIPHGIDLGFFTPAVEKTAMKGGRLRCLHVGNYLRDFALLARLTRELEQEPVEFHVVGNPVHREQHDFAPATQWSSGLSIEALRELYREADVLVMTATGATANNAILEGMACGLPVVCEDLGGLPAYVPEDGSVLCPPKDAGALAAALRDLAASPERLEPMGEAIQRHVQTLAWPAIAERSRELYEDVIARVADGFRNGGPSGT